MIDPVFRKDRSLSRIAGRIGSQAGKGCRHTYYADHVSAMAATMDHTNCVTVMGEQSPVDVVSMRVSDAENVTIEGFSMTAMYTPGHTDDSYCFRTDDRVFTGDTLLIRERAGQIFKMVIRVCSMSRFLTGC